MLTVDELNPSREMSAISLLMYPSKVPTLNLEIQNSPDCCG